MGSDTGEVEKVMETAMAVSTTIAETAVAEAAEAETMDPVVALCEISLHEMVVAKDTDRLQVGTSWISRRVGKTGDAI